MNNIVIVSHKFVTQPDDDFVEFLNNKKLNNVLHIRHSFSDAADRCSYYSWYKDGALYRHKKTKDFKNFPEFIIYFKEFYFTIKWIIDCGVKWDVYIGMDGLCVMFGNFLRIFKKAKKTVYWVIDFVPAKRFNSFIKSYIYYVINKTGYKRSDEVWDLGVRMVEARKKFWNMDESYYKKRIIVPYGVWNKRIKKYSYKECYQNTLVFMGHLLPKQGVQLIIKLIPKIKTEITNFKFKIIGDGKYKKQLIQLAEEMNVLNDCCFMGKIEDIKKLEEEVAKSCLAVAPYIKSLDTWTYYTDPGKIKTYIGCGVPLLLTDISWNAKDIHNNRCGVIINEEDEYDILKNIIKLFNAPINQEYRNNAIKYSESFDYANIFNKIKF